MCKCRIYFRCSFYTLRDMQDTLKVFLVGIMINACYITGVYFTHKGICMKHVRCFWQKSGHIIWNIFILLEWVDDREGQGIIHLFIMSYLVFSSFSSLNYLLFSSLLFSMSLHMCLWNRYNNLHVYMYLKYISNLTL